MEQLPTFAELIKILKNTTTKEGSNVIVPYILNRARQGKQGNQGKNTFYVSRFSVSALNHPTPTFVPFSIAENNEAIYFMFNTSERPRTHAGNVGRTSEQVLKPAISHVTVTREEWDRRKDGPRFHVTVYFQSRPISMSTVTIGATKKKQSKALLESRSRTHSAAIRNATFDPKRLTVGSYENTCKMYYMIDPKSPESLRLLRIGNGLECDKSQGAATEEGKNAASSFLHAINAIAIANRLSMLSRRSRAAAAPPRQNETRQNETRQNETRQIETRQRNTFDVSSSSKSWIEKAKRLAQLNSSVATPPHKIETRQSETRQRNTFYGSSKSWAIKAAEIARLSSSRSSH